MMVRASVLLLLLALPSLARADILVWRDSQGVSHYTNSKSVVPEGASVSVVLEEPVHPAEEPPPRAAQAEQAPPPREAQVVYEQGALAGAYAEGWQRGLEAARQMQAPPSSVNVQIGGPLVAANNGGWGGGGYDAAWWAYNYPALVTTSFDRGRSRHLTLRLLMQDQFAIDREGPYFIVDRFPPQGPNLPTVLPRGLPMVNAPGSLLSNRVITH